MFFEIKIRGLPPKQDSEKLVGLLDFETIREGGGGEFRQRLRFEILESNGRVQRVHQPAAFLISVVNGIRERIRVP